MSRTAPFTLIVAIGLGCTGTIQAPEPELPTPVGGRRVEPNPGESAPGAAPGTTSAAPPASMARDVAVPDPAASAPVVHGPLVPDATFQCTQTADASAPARLWRLTQLQLQNTLRAAFKAVVPMAGDDPLQGLRLPFGEVEAGDRFSTNSRSYGIDEASFRDLMDATGYVARRLVSDLKTGSCVGSADFSGCVSSLVAKVARAFLRRPLLPDEVQQYATIALGQRSAGDAEAMTTALQALLLSPEVSFRYEGGAAGRVGPMDPWAMASAISYTLTDAPPDAMLADAASRGALGTAADVAVYSRRVLSSNAGLLRAPDFVNAIFPLSPMERFFREYLRYGDVDRVDKDAKLFPFHKPYELLAVTRRLVNDIIVSKAAGGLLPELLTTSVAYVNHGSFENYGLSGTFTDNMVRSTLADRAGVLTQPSWLSGHSQPQRNDPIRRGRFIRETMLCQKLPDLPIGQIPPLDAGKFPVLRDGLTAHTANPTCAACHRMMDPIGLAFEAFDHVGRMRTTEGGKPVDTHWEIVGATEPGLAGVHEGVRELGARLAASPTVARCFVAHSFMYWMGRAPGPGDGCVLDGALQAFEKSGGSYPELVGALMSSPSFMLRRTP